jgi:uncharacterized protein involved in type VI secretion and phage assembly
VTELQWDGHPSFAAKKAETKQPAQQETRSANHAMSTQPFAVRGLASPLARNDTEAVEAAAARLCGEAGGRLMT